MALSADQLRELLANPRETLDVELKRWLDPKSDEGRAKIAKGCLALWNSGGGLFVIGFDDKTLQPDTDNAPPDVEATFHQDAIQAIVGEFASQPFPVQVGFGERDGRLYPVISIPGGVRTPVAAKKDFAPGGKMLIKDHAVYVRSLASNGTVSSSEPKRGDWERVVSRWFDNREADIGGFVRRHLTALDLGALTAALGATPPPRPSNEERVRAVLDHGRGRFTSAMKNRRTEVPAIGFREAAVLIDGEVPSFTANNSFLQQLLVAKPRHTGWTPWLDTRSGGGEGQPYVYEQGWEALLVQLGDPVLLGGHLDFWRMDPRGTFYHLRALEDDMREKAYGLRPRTQLDFPLQISRTAEIISTGLSFGRSMGCEPAKTTVVFGFRWSGLQGRFLSTRGERRPFFDPAGPAAEDRVTTSVAIPLDVPQSGISPFVELAVRDLFALFAGQEFQKQVYEEIVADTVQRRY